MHVPFARVTATPSRRAFLQNSLGAAALALWPGSLAALAASNAKAVLDEFADSNTRIAHRLNVRGLTDDDLLFLQQIGLRWVRLEWGAEPVSFDELRTT